MLEISYGRVQMNSAQFMDKNRQIYFCFSVAFCVFFFPVTKLFLGHSLGCPPFHVNVFFICPSTLPNTQWFLFSTNFIQQKMLSHIWAIQPLVAHQHRAHIMSFNSTVEQMLFGIQCIFMTIFHVLRSAWKLAATSLHGVPEQVVWMCRQLQDKLIVDHYSRSLNR